MISVLGANAEIHNQSVEAMAPPDQGPARTEVALDIDYEGVAARAADCRRAMVEAEVASDTVQNGDLRHIEGQLFQIR